jgi:aspartyl/asparaginyl-tRNA synthetase
LNRRVRIVAWVCLLLSLSCRGAVPTPIREILDHPERYDGKSVTVAGEVESATNLVVIRYYRVRDATGTISVITPKAVPRRGTTVRVKGIVHQAFAVGDESLTVLNEEAE